MNATTQARIATVLAARHNEDDLYAALVLALRGQDRTTRHACAEAIVSSSCGGQYPALEVSQALQAAHQACINTVSV